MEAQVAVLQAKQLMQDKTSDRIVTQQDEILKMLRGIEKSQSDLGNRITDLENQMKQAAPTIQEFITVKTEVKAAGKVGKWVWVAVSWLFAALAGLAGLVTTFKSQIVAWMTGA